MIASLRRRHRWMMVGLTAGLPVLLAASLVDRPGMPSGDLPGELLASASGQALAGGEVAFTEHRGSVTRFEDALQLELASGLRAPDVLAYWSSTAADPSAGLPRDARLLGAVDPARANLYAVDAADSGHLVLYSLGHQTVVDSAALGAVAGFDPPDPSPGITPDESTDDAEARP
ncbi:MAG: hypothetical protein AAGF23_03755 [Acidobacteriota bacterium]